MKSIVNSTTHRHNLLRYFPVRKAVDLFYEDRFQGPGLAEELSVRFRVDNIFDEEPEIYRLNNQPSYRDFSLGRVCGLGVTKRFH